MRRTCLTADCSRLALAALLIAQPLAQAPVLAQAFQGTPTIAGGSASIGRVPGQDVITTFETQTTINWRPDDVGVGGGAINFLPDGATAIFNSQLGATPVTILNRIIAADPTRSIAFNGAVISDTNVAVWFYAPGGILVGSRASFNVASLLLTANDPVVVGGYGEFLNPDGSFALRSAVGSSAAVQIDPGAFITAPDAGSYVIAVAPRIVHSGVITVNGSAALVAAEGVDLRLNAGLFDITVTTGTTGNGSANQDPLIVNGGIGGPAAAAGATNRIYLVAVPKNDAITMFIGGPNASLGFDVAGSADVVGNAIVLSAGRNVIGTGGGNPIGTVVVTPGTADIRVNNGVYTSLVTGAATGSAVVRALTGNASFANDLNITGVVAASIGATNGFTLGIAGNALAAATGALSGPAGLDRTAGAAAIFADAGSTLTIGGNADILAVGIGDFSGFILGGTGIGGTGTGGSARLYAENNAVVSIGGNVITNASGFGGSAFAGQAGNGIGGSGGITADGGSTLSIGGFAAAIAAGQGGRGDFRVIAGSGTGGNMAIVSTGGSTLTIANLATIDVRGDAGGQSQSEASGGGSGTGGTGLLSAGSGSAALIGGIVQIRAEGVGGDVPGGNGIGGTAAITTAGIGGVVSIGGDEVRLGARGSGGSGDGLTPGGTGTGGTARVFADGGRITLTGSGAPLALDAGAVGGSGGGTANGGRIFLQAANGGSFAASLDVSLDATSAGGIGQFGNGGNATGGTVLVGTTGAPSSLAIGGNLLIDGQARGGNGDGRSGMGNGGNAAGAQAAITLVNGSLSVGGRLDMLTTAFAGRGTNGGNAIGGENNASVVDAAFAVNGIADANANATGGDARDGGTGGSAAGGSIDWMVESGGGVPASLTAASFQLDTIATGGNGGFGLTDQAGGSGGTATGGNANLMAHGQTGSILQGASVSVQANGFGGDGGNGGFSSVGIAPVGGTGGDATGGIVIVGTDCGIGGGLLATFADLGSVDIHADASGGRGGFLSAGRVPGFGGRGGNATGGSASLLARGNTVRASVVNLSAIALGGDGGGFGSGGGYGGSFDAGGGSAIGGFAGAIASPHTLSANPVTLTLDSLSATATATGGTSSNRTGDATGGQARLTLTQHGSGAPLAPITGTVTIAGAVTLRADATGGSPRFPSAIGGFGTGGIAQITAEAGAMAVGGGAILSAFGFGGSSGISQLTPGTGTGGTAQLLINGGSAVFSGSFTSFIADAAQGNARGGTAGLVSGSDGGSVSFASAVSFSADAFSGGSPGASLTGGTVVITGTTGSDIGFAGDVIVTARAIVDDFGLSVRTIANGGSAVVTSGGAMRFGGVLDVDVSALGDQPELGIGNAAVGGSALVNASGGSLSLQGLTLRANASGGNAASGDGGSATGGSVELRAENAGSLGITAAPLLDVLAQAGNGSGGAGGLATGGTAQLRSLGAGSAITITAPAAETRLDVIAIGGTGTTPGGSRFGSAAITAIGGRIDLASARITIIGTTAATAQPSGIFARGGSIGLAGDLAITTPGDAVLGADNALITAGGALTVTAGARVVATGDGTPIAAPGTISAASILVSAATGIDTPTNFTAATSLDFIAGSGAMRLGNLVAVDTIDLDAALGMTTGSITSSAGNVILAASSITAGNISAARAAQAVAAGTITVGNIGAGPAIVLLGSSVATGGLATARDGNIRIASNTMASLITRAGGNPDYSTLFAAAPVRLPGTITIAGPVSTGVIRAAATGAITATGPVDAALGIGFDAGNLLLADLTTGGFLALTTDSNLTAGNIRAETDVDLAASGDITTGTIGAGDAVSVTTLGSGRRITTGAIDAGILRPSAESAATYAVAIDGAGPVTTGAITAGGNVAAVARGTALQTGAIIAGTRSIPARVAGVGPLQIGGVAAGNAVILLAGTGVTTGAITTPAAGAVLIASDRMASLITRVGGTADYTALLAAVPVRLAGAIDIGGVATGRFSAASTVAFAAPAITASQSATIDTGGLASFTGLVSAPVITVTAADIALTGGLGTAATTQITLNIDPASTAVTLGGAGGGSGYVLDNAEAGRLRARAIAIAAPGTAPVTVGALTLSGSGLATNGNVFGVRSGGNIRVNGSVALTGAGAGDVLRLDAAGRIEVATDSGGRIGLTSTGDMLSGTLDLAAASIWVGTADLLGQLATDVNFAGRGALLARVPATPDLAGALAAGGIGVSARGSVLIQNSGSTFQRAGFSSGMAGFRITAAGSAPLDVVINGRAQDAAGTFFINATTVDRLTFVSGEGGGFTATSSVNGCVIGQKCADTAITNPIANISTNLAELALSPAEQVQRGRLTDALDTFPAVRIARLVDLGEAIANPLITEPVTGGGNPALWLDVPIAGARPVGGLK